MEGPLEVKRGVIVLERSLQVNQGMGGVGWKGPSRSTSDCVELKGSFQVIRGVVGVEGSLQVIFRSIRP